MKSIACKSIHRMKYDKRKLTPQKTRETRALLGSRFKILLSDAGLSPEAAAQLLHVTPRTIRYWISGKVTVPYAAYKLVRVMRLFELPCEGWQGWHMHSGKLWSPEGYGFTPDCQSWWSLLVRQARLFRDMANRERQLDIAMHRMKDGGAELPCSPTGCVSVLEGGAAAPVTPTAQRAGGAADRPNLFIEHFRTQRLAANEINDLDSFAKLVAALIQGEKHV